MTLIGDGIEVVDDPADPRLSDYLGLTDVVLRTRLEPANGLYLAESEKVIRRALRAGHRPRSLLLAERWLAPMADLVATVQAAGASVYTGTAPAIEAVTGFHVHRGAIASMHRPALAPVQEVLASIPKSAHSRIAILEDIVDHTNVGAILRSCAALGVDAVLVTPRCADPLYRRAVRVSMGAVFQLPWTRLESWPGDLELVRAAGFTVVGLGLNDQSVTLDELVGTHPGPLAFVLGAEGDGLKPSTVDVVDVVCRIPMSGGVDSLNVAAAAAVAFYATR
jgi:tRNA G18 (ribose-2'-O)-methylase SpoU